MAVLHNRVSQEELKKRLYEETEHRITVSFYQYFFIDNTQQFRDDLYKGLNELNVFGRIYVASEGINAQASIPESKFESFKAFLFGFHPMLNQLLMASMILILTWPIRVNMSMQMSSIN
jgi:UPF0176 protein